MASFKKTKSGAWQASVYVGRDGNGKQLFRYVTKNTLKEAKDAARAIEQDVADGDLSNVGYMPLSKYLEQWYDLNKNQISPTTAVQYRMYIDTHIVPALGNERVGDITELQIKAYIADKISSISANTARKHLFFLRRIFYEALKHKSPCEDIKPPKLTKYKPRLLTAEEFLQLHDIVRDTSDELPILLAAWCGLRQGEVMALKWGDINTELGTIRVDESLAISDSGYVLKGPKSDNGYREIVAPERVMEILQGMNVGKKDVRIFSMRPDSYSKRFHKILIRNDLPLIRYHDLRHYHASQLYMHGFDDIYAANRLGHDVYVLKTIYQQMEQTYRLKMDKKIKGLFSENPTKNPTQT